MHTTKLNEINKYLYADIHSIILTSIVLYIYQYVYIKINDEYVLYKSQKYPVHTQYNNNKIIYKRLNNTMDLSVTIVAFEVDPLLGEK